MNGKVTYRQQYTRCGKQRCRKCQEGAGHGPYWYAYWKENGRTITRYLGIHAPAEVEKQERQIISIHEKKTLGTREVIEAVDSGHMLALRNGTDETPARVERQSQEKVTLVTEDAQTRLRIYLLGQFRVERKEGNIWQKVVSRIWQRRRVRSLLGCLLSQPGRRMGREQVMEALWPDLDIEAAANRLNGAVHELRQTLEPELERPAASRLLRLEHEVLVLADASQIWVDTEDFEGVLNRANTTTDAAQVERLLEAAAALYHGDYLLEELYSPWAAARRESLRRGWIGLLLKLTELRTARGALSSAIEPLDRLLMTDPTHETAVRSLMLLLTRLDRRGEAMRVYQRLASLLKSDYESDPFPETVELYKALQQGQIKASSPITGPLPMANLSQAQVERKKGNKNQQHIQEANNAPSPSQPKRDIAVPLVLPQNLPHPHVPRGRQNQSPFIGRKCELETMRQMLMAIDNTSSRSEEKDDKKGEARERLSNPTRFVMIKGEAGIGKTRLAEELNHEAQARGWLVAWTRAYELEGTVPYRAWTDILRSLLQDISLNQLINLLEGKTGRATDESPRLLTLTATARARLTRLSVLLPELTTHQDLYLSQNHARVSAVSERDRFYLWETMLFLLNTLSQSAPLLLVLDDLHWTDDSSLELLAYLVRHLHHERILLVGTYRDTELASGTRLRLLLNDLHREQVLETFPLQPLTHTQIGSLIAYLPQELVHSIQNRASGNPFFAEELARFSVSVPGTGSNKKRPGNGHHPGSFDEMVTGVNRLTPLPDTIMAVLDGRLNKLSRDCQTLLSKAAVLGGSFECDLLLRMAGNAQANEDATLNLLEEALHSGFLSEEGSGPRIVYHFWHPLIVSHLYEQISAARRALLHRRAAQALIELHANNEVEVAATIAYHLGKSDPEKQRLIYYAELAGNRAMTLSAYPEALHHYHQALNALQALNATTVQKQDERHLADLLECMAECNTRQGNYADAQQQYIQALELHGMQQADASTFADPKAFLSWQQEEAQVQAIIWRLRGGIWNDTGDYSQAHACVLRGKEILRAAGITNDVAWACLEHLDGAIYSDEGNFKEARRHVEASLEIHEEALGKILTREHGAIGPASKENAHSPLLMTRSRRMLQGNPLDPGLEREALGVICSGMGLYAEALQHLYAALKVYEKHDLVGAMGQCYSNIGAVHTMRAEYEIARVYYKRALEVTERTGDFPSKALIVGNLGDIAWRCGDLQEAETWLIESLALAEQVTDRDGACWCLVTLGIVQHDLGNARGGLEKIRRAQVMAKRMNSTVRMGFALAGLADWLTTQALIRSNHKATNLAKNAVSTGGIRLLHLARAAAERALALDGIDSETKGIGQAALAHIHLLQNNVDIAQQLALTTLEEARQNEAIHLIGRSQRLLGKIQAARGFEGEAEKYFEQALQVFKQYGLRLEYARTLQSYGTSLLVRNKHLSADDSTDQRGLDYMRKARALFETCQASIDLHLSCSIEVNLKLFIGR